jgi:hypothetical protein
MAANSIAVISMCNTIIGSIQMTSLKHVLSVEHCLDMSGWCGVTGARITGLCMVGLRDRGAKVIVTGH